MYMHLKYCLSLRWINFRPKCKKQIFKCLMNGHCWELRPCVLINKHMKDGGTCIFTGSSQQHLDDWRSKNNTWKRQWKSMSFRHWKQLNWRERTHLAHSWEKQSPGRGPWLKEEASENKGWWDKAWVQNSPERGVWPKGFGTNSF